MLYIWLRCVGEGERRMHKEEKEAVYGGKGGCVGRKNRLHKEEKEAVLVSRRGDNVREERIK